MCVTAASFDRRADGQWKAPLRLSPVTHRTVAKLEKSLAPLTEKRPRIGKLFARESLRNLVGRLDRPQPGLFSPDIVAGGRCKALPFRHLNLEHDHIAQPKRHFRAGQIKLPHPHEALIVETYHLVAMGE